MEYTALAFEHMIEREQNRRSRDFEATFSHVNEKRMSCLQEAITMLEESAELPQNLLEGNIRESPRFRQLKDEVSKIKEHEKNLHQEWGLSNARLFEIRKELE